MTYKKALMPIIKKTFFFKDEDSFANIPSILYIVVFK